MPRFVFTLEPVMKQRIREEERAQRALAEREAARLEAERELRRIQARIEAARQAWRQQLVGPSPSEPGGDQRGGGDVREVRLQAGATIKEMAEFKRSILTLASARKRVAEARAALLEAARRRLAIQDLRERRWNEWRSEQGRLEQRSLDDLTVMGHGRATRHDQGAW